MSGEVFWGSAQRQAGGHKERAPYGGHVSPVCAQWMSEEKTAHQILSGTEEHPTRERERARERMRENIREIFRQREKIKEWEKNKG